MGFRPRGLSLVELLVVVAAVSVLAALLLPAAAAARGKGDAVRCLQNLRSLGAGLLQYAADHRGELPASAYGGVAAATTRDGPRKWMDVIYPYIGRESAYLCPSDAGARYRYAGNLGGGESSTDYGSYGMNGAYRDAGDAQTPPRSAGQSVVTRAMIERPGETVWVGDCLNREEANGSFGFTWASAGTQPTVSGRPPRLDKLVARHGGKAGLLFCDGAVRFEALDRVAELKEIVDAVDGARKRVMTAFTIEAD